MRVISFLCLVWLTLEASARQCGSPAKSDYTLLNAVFTTFVEDAQVSYTCKPNYYTLRETQLFREENRTCQCNGIWSGVEPDCNFRDYTNKQSHSMRNYTNASDDDDDTCDIFKFNNQGRVEFTVALARPNPVVLLVRLVYEVINVTIQPTVSISYKNRRDWEQCYTSRNGTFERNVVIAPCNLVRLQGAPNSTRSSSELKLELSLPQSYPDASIKICSLHGLGETSKPCGSPGQLHNGNVTLQGNNATYSCNPGYTLLGSKTSSCRTIENIGYWTTDKIPICISDEEKNCRQLPEVAHGRLVFAKPTCPSDYNIHYHSDVAVVQCSYGFFPKVSHMLAYCNETTKWTWKLGQQDLPFASVCRSRASSTETMHSNISQRFDISIVALAVAGGVTLFNVLYCIYRCQRKKFGVRKTKKQPDDLPLDVLNSTTCRPPSFKADSVIYEEICDPFRRNKLDSLEDRSQHNATYVTSPRNKQDETHGQRSTCEALYQNDETLYSNIFVN